MKMENEKDKQSAIKRLYNTVKHSLTPTRAEKKTYDHELIRQNKFFEDSSELIKQKKDSRNNQKVFNHEPVRPNKLFDEDSPGIIDLNRKKHRYNQKNFSDEHVQPKKLFQDEDSLELNLMQKIFYREAMNLDDEKEDNIEKLHMKKLKYREEIEVRKIGNTQGKYQYTFFAPTTDKNTIYDPQLCRKVFRKEKSTTLKSTHRRTTRLLSIMHIFEIVIDLCKSKKWATKSQVWYRGKSKGVFRTQKDSDDAIEDVACSIGCTRTSLRITAAEKGMVIGNVQFKDDGDLIDCTKQGRSGKNIPSNIERITEIRSIDDKALFILLVETDSVFKTLAEDKFYETYPCIIITGKGMPDVATRLFLHKLEYELKLPVYGLFDCNPKGLEILLTYTIGSKAMSYDSMNLVTPRIKWLGLRFEDLDYHKVPKSSMIKMSKDDNDTIKRLKKEEYLQKNEPWMKSLTEMEKSKQKAELECLFCLDNDYLTKIYLPTKFKNLDFI